MNVYDGAHQLARAIQESEEFLKYKELEKEVMSDESLKNMLEDFQKRQLALQKTQMMGEELDQSEVEKAQQLFEVINKDPKASEYFACEMRLSQMLADVSKILADAMDFKRN